MNTNGKIGVAANRLVCFLLGAAVTLVASSSGAETCTYEDGAWKDGKAPTAAEDEIVIASGELTWDSSLPAKVASWTQTGGTVTFATTFADATGVTAFPFVEVVGDVSFSGGTWKHLANSNAKTYRLFVKCGGNMEISSGATIDAAGLGYTKFQLMGHPAQGGNQAGSYGGHGGMQNACPCNWTYGSLFEPEDLGNCCNGAVGYGGGSVRLDITGKLTHNGIISVMGGGTAAYYTGAGGSIFIHAGSIEGAGTMSADTPATAHLAGSGGRIAIILTDDGADFSKYDVFNQVSAHPLMKSADQGGCGTIYAETAADGANHGWLILKGTGSLPATDHAYQYYADPFSDDLTSANFSKITIAGKTKFYLNEGYTLDATGTIFDCREADCGLVLNGGTLMGQDDKVMSLGGFVECPIEATVMAANAEIVKDCVLTISGKLTFSGNLTVASGAKVTTLAAAKQPNHKLNLQVNGNLMVAEGGAIDVSGCGYVVGYGLDGVENENAGGTHGGWGLTSGGAANKLAPYGSIVNPQTPGTGGFQNNSGNSSSGGGVALLDVGGLLTVNGSILANAKSANYYSGAGGSINIIAGGLAGAATGLIEASDGGCKNFAAAAGGGRVAVRLTGDGADFTSFAGAIRARSYGQTGGTDKTRRAGAGTVYLRTAAESETEGTLIVDNGDATSSGQTVLGGAVEGLAFGDIVIGGGANVVLSDGALLKVSGDFVNGAAFTAGAGSTVEFVGTGTSTVSGDTTFANLSSTASGKTILFAAGSTQKVTGDISVSGEGENIVLKSTTDGEKWNLDTTGASVALSGVAIGDCRSAVAILATDGEDLSGNENVTVEGALTPMTLAWTGEADSAWGNPLNWGEDGRIPTKVDTVIIPPTAVAPVLSVGTKIAALTVTGKLTMGEKTLEITGPLTVGGEFALTGAALVRVGGDVSITGKVEPGDSTLALVGTARQNASFDGSALASVLAENPNVTFSGALACRSLTLGSAAVACDYAFAEGMTVDADSFTVKGTGEGQPNVGMRSTVSGKSWSLKTLVFNVAGAVVSDSDASRGVLVIPQNSTDGGRNVKWMFEDTRIRWTGEAGNADFANGANWKGGTAPDETDSVVIEGDWAVVVGATTKVSDLTLGFGAKLTVNAALTVDGTLTVEPQGALVGNRPISVSGDLVVVDGGVLTHDANTKNTTDPNNRLELTVAGSGFLTSGAVVDVSEKGYTAAGGYQGPGLPSGDARTAASYGGRGYCGATPASACYGSIANPVDVGSVGSSGGNGGGAVILRFGKELTLNADITANALDSGDYYSASGGSINLKAGSLVGTGDLVANGGAVTVMHTGAGGRIAVVLTDAGATFDGYTGTMQTYGGKIGASGSGSAGTIYTKTAADPFGTLRIANYTPSAKDMWESREMTDFPATQDNDPKEVDRVNLRLGAYSTLNLTADATVSSLVLEDDTVRIKLNGHRLSVMEKPSLKIRKEILSHVIPGEDAEGNPGTLVWPSGLILMVR